jgi:hypothetical protein
MNKTIKIMHIDPDFRVTYFINQQGILISSHLSLEQAISLLKKEKFDLILSEPHQKAILEPQDRTRQINSNFFYGPSNRKQKDFRYGQNKKPGHV